MEIAVKPGDHQQLLEQLRRLRQGVELAGVHAAGDQKVAGAFGRAACEDGGLVLQKAHVGEAAADAGGDLGTQDDVAVQGVAPQVEKAVLEADVLVALVLNGDGKGQCLGGAEDFHAVGHHFDAAGGQLGVARLGGAGNHLAGKAGHGFGVQVGAFMMERTVGMDDHLGQAVMVPQVQKGDAAMVADPVHPAGEADNLSHVGITKLAASM